MSVTIDKAGPRRAARISSEDTILAAAEVVFAERGFDGATTAGIAAAAGLPKSNVHYYFATKEQLYRKVIERVLKAWLDAARAFDEVDSASEALARYIGAKMDLARERPHGSRVFAKEIMRGAPIAQEFLETTLKTWIRDREAVVRRWIGQGQLRPVEPRTLFFMIWATTQHYADFAHQIATLNGGAPLSDQEFRAAKRHVIGIILDGIEQRHVIPAR
jgi:TetR/AcrR family transcriptional regulator